MHLVKWRIEFVSRQILLPIKLENFKFVTIPSGSTIWQYWCHSLLLSHQLAVTTVMPDARIFPRHSRYVQNKQYLPSRLFLLIVYNIRSSHHRHRAEACTWSPTVMSALSCYRCNCRLTSQINLQPLNQIIFTGCLSH